MIIGITGSNGAGKGAATEYLKAKGYVIYSLSDVVREEAAARGLDNSRANLVKTGRELRDTYGPDVLVVKLEPKLNTVPTGKFVVDSIRNTGEIQRLRINPAFVLLGIDAAAEIRYNRIVTRSRAGDTLTYKAFIKNEQTENSSTAAGQQLGKCIQEADIIILNNTTLDSFHKRINIFLEGVERYVNKQK
ncbi:MAG: AAA family ATPase [Elusimicrobiota bacterium]